MKKYIYLFSAVFSMLLLHSCSSTPNAVNNAGDKFKFSGVYKDFTLTANIKTSDLAEAVFYFSNTEENEGYKVFIHNGISDGTLKTGSLISVRNLYRSIAGDDKWFKLFIAVNDKTINVKINDIDVVCYQEPESPWRNSEHKTQLLTTGEVGFSVLKGTMELSDVSILPQSEKPSMAVSPIDEQNDKIIRLQQENFPVIDYHVHLKGDLTKEMAHQMSLNYGINYGVAPNAGEGGVGRMLANDKEVYEYYNEINSLPFLFGVQGEGRKWTAVFSAEALGIFEYLFTDAMTIIDHKGRNSRIYRAEEVHFDGITKEQYMDHLVDQMVLILQNEPADIYANATYIPDIMLPDYDKYWTDERIEKVLDVLKKNKIALEINPRYKIPSFYIIKKAKEYGLKFTFGTNNVDSNFGKLEYCIEAIKECNLTAEDIWFPSNSIRRERKTVIYNHFTPDGKRVVNQ